MPTKTKAQPKDTTATSTAFKLPQRYLEFRVKALERQQSFVESGLDRLEEVQGQSEERFVGWLESSSTVPSELTDLAKEWNSTFEAMRKSYRGSVAKSFDLAKHWYDNQISATS